MRKITIDLPEAKQVEINGEIYDVLKSDFDVLEKASGFIERGAALGSSDAKAVSAFVRETVYYIDELLGEGAVKRITGGKPVGINKMFEMLKIVCEAVALEYADGALKDYE